jgi:hypothetical protein
MAQQTVIYEITAIVQADFVEEYEKFIRQRHIPDLLATGYFRAAAYTRSSIGRYRIRYEAFDQHSLDKYLDKDAPHLRADFLRHFPNGVEISREVWEVIEEWQIDPSH